MSKAINWYIYLRDQLVGGHLGGLKKLGGVSRIFLGHFQQIINTLSESSAQSQLIDTLVG